MNTSTVKTVRENNETSPPPFNHANARRNYFIFPPRLAPAPGVLYVIPPLLFTDEIAFRGLLNSTGGEFSGEPRFLTYKITVPRL